MDLKTKLETALDILNSGDTEFVVTSPTGYTTVVSVEPFLQTYLSATNVDIKRAPQWQLTNHLPGFRALEGGEEWHTTEGWVEADLPAGYRPLLKGEPRSPKDTEVSSEISCWSKSTAIVPVRGGAMKARTTRPLPLGIEELANAIRTAKFKAENTKAQQWAATSTLTKDAWIAAAKKAKELLTAQP